MQTPSDRKRAFAQFIRSHGHRASIAPGTGELIAYIRGTSYVWGNCPTWRTVRVALGLPTEYIELTTAD